MNGRQQLITLVVTLAFGLSCIIGAVILAALHDLDGQVVAAILTGGMALAGGHAIGLSSIGSAVNGKAQLPPDVLRQLVDAVKNAQPDTPATQQELAARETAQPQPQS